MTSCTEQDASKQDLRIYVHSRHVANHFSNYKYPRWHRGKQTRDSIECFLVYELHQLQQLYANKRSSGDQKPQAAMGC
jgi:hypothetical protein